MYDLIMKDNSAILSSDGSSIDISGYDIDYSCTGSDNTPVYAMIKVPIRSISAESDKYKVITVCSECGAVGCGLHPQQALSSGIGVRSVDTDTAPGYVGEVHVHFTSTLRSDSSYSYPQPQIYISRYNV